MRVSSVAFPLYEDDMKKIPPRLLTAKADEGTRKHKMLQNAIETGFVNIPENGIEAMFEIACGQIGITPEGKCEQHLTNEVNCMEGQDPLTGHPDLYNDDDLFIIDYKFTDELRNETALQLAGYAEFMWGDYRWLAFHYPTDRILTVYEVREAVKSILRDFFMKLIERYDEIRESFSAKMWALSEWRKIQTDNEIFVPVCTVQPEIQIKTFDDAASAVMVLREMARLKKKETALKVEINRFLDENGIDELAAGLKRITYDRHNYAVPKNIKEQYETGTSKVTKLILT